VRNAQWEVNNKYTYKWFSTVVVVAIDAYTI